MTRPGGFSYRLWLPLVLVFALAGAAVAGMAARASLTASKAKVVKVTEKEYTITFATKTFKPGATTFVVINKGKLSHEFEINGPGVHNKRIPGVIAPGQKKMLKVTLRKGSYRVWCPIHIGLGMKATIKVGAATTMSSTTSTTSTSGTSTWA